MVDESALETRLACLERAVAELRQRGGVGNWLAKFTGSVPADDAFEQIQKYGREFRHADRPVDDPCDAA